MSTPVHIVLGAAGGVGRELVSRLRQAGAEVVAAGRDSDALDALSGEFGAHAREVDARDFAAVDRVVKDAARDLGRVDGIANCAGSLILKPAHATSEEEFGATVDANLRTAFAAVRAAAGAMRKEGGSVVLVSSAAARIGLANHEAIAAAKAGVIGLTLSAAASYAPRGIRVNAVAPGLTRTPMTAKITESEAMAQGSTDLHALGRLGEPGDVASAIAWLLDRENSWVTGQVLGVDGGLGRVRSRKG